MFCVVDECYILYGSGCVFFFQAEDGIRDLVRSRGLGDVYKRTGVVMSDIVLAFIEVCHLEKRLRMVILS